MTVSIIQNSFTGGEWSPSLYGRSDLQKYPTAVRKMRNFILHPHGGASNRGGTQLVCETKDSSKTSRLISFQFSVEQSYILEFGDQYMRIIKDGGQVVLSSAPAAYNGSTTYAQGDHCSYSGVNYYSLQGSNTGNQPDISSAYWYALTDDIVEIKTPYLEADLSLLKYTQSADILYITHPSYAPMKLSRINHDEWTIETIVFAADVETPTNFSRSAGSGTGHTYAVTAVTEIGEESLVSSSATGAAGDTFTWDAVSGADQYNFYEDNNGIWGYIGAAGSNSFKVPSSVDPDMEKTPPKNKDPFDAANKYPGCCTFFQQRFLSARTNNKPQTLWGSVTGSFQNMNVSSPIKADDSFEFTINSQQVNEIRWMVPLDELIIGTSGSEWKLRAGGDSDSVTPLSRNLTMQSRYGVSHIQPIIVGGTIIFIEGSDNVVRDFFYSLEADKYQGNDLSILGNHLFRDKKITEWCYQRHPDSIIWAVRDDGVLLGLTYYREHEVWGWHWHDTKGLFKSIASVTTASGVSEVYMIVERTINSTTKKFIERFMPRLPNDSVEDAYFVDCGLTYSGAAATTISGLDHLEGEEVSVLADGNVVYGLTVSGGEITLPNAAEEVHVGLGYVSDLETLDIEIQTETGSIQDKIRDIVSVVVRLENTRALWVGPDENNLDEIAFRENEDYGDPITLYTGDKELPINSGEVDEARVFFRNTDPVPVTLISVISKVSYEN